MAKIMKRVLSGLLLVMIIFLATSCKYGAKIVDSGMVFRDGVLNANMTYGAYYIDEGSEEYLYDESSPKTRTYVLKEETKSQEMFSEFPHVDFKKEMVLVHFYTDVYSRERKIKSVEVGEDKILRIVFKLKSAWGKKDASMPQQKVLVIKMNKLDINSAEIIKE